VSPRRDLDSDEQIIHRTVQRSTRAGGRAECAGPLGTRFVLAGSAPCLNNPRYATPSLGQAIFSLHYGTVSNRLCPRAAHTPRHTVRSRRSARRRRLSRRTTARTTVSRLGPNAMPRERTRVRLGWPHLQKSLSRPGRGRGRLPPRRVLRERVKQRGRAHGRETVSISGSTTLTRWSCKGNSVLRTLSSLTAEKIFAPKLRNNTASAAATPAAAGVATVTAADFGRAPASGIAAGHALTIGVASTIATARPCALRRAGCA
jgi:hypothetical protein